MPITSQSNLLHIRIFLITQSTFFILPPNLGVKLIIESTLKKGGQNYISRTLGMINRPQKSDF